MVIRDEDYAQTMTDTVEPYLAARRQECFLERTRGEAIYTEFYTADTATATVLISHGFTETAEKFREVIYYFLQNHYNVCILEHCGHGNSYRLTSGDLSLVHVDRFERYVKDLGFVAQVARREFSNLPLVLFAHSMGGGIGAALALKEPGLFDRLILTSPMIMPITAGLPFGVAVGIARCGCVLGLRKRYVIGHHRFSGKETFEKSPDDSRARYDYYQKEREAKPHYQMSGASYGWLYETGRLHAYLMEQAAKTKLFMPILLFSAGNEAFVVNGQQEKFLALVRANHPRPELVRQVLFERAKHELYMQESLELARYYQEIFQKSTR